MVLGVDVEVPDGVDVELVAVPEDGAGEASGAAPDAGLGVPSFLSPAVFSLDGDAGVSLPAGGLSLSE